MEVHIYTNFSGQENLSAQKILGNFLPLRCDGFTVKWERHTEFTRYTIIQALPAHATCGSDLPGMAQHVATGTHWLSNIPGKTEAAIQLEMLTENMMDAAVLEHAQRWLGEGTGIGIGSHMGNLAYSQSQAMLQSERATAEHGYRFSATRAYYAIVQERIAELREPPITGTQTVSEFMQRRLAPAMATVAATSQRMGALSERITRTSALLRTRVVIAAEVHNQQLLQKLIRGQKRQLQLQSTVEGLSIAAISDDVVSLILYIGKALKVAGVPVQPEVLAGRLTPLVLWFVWRTVQRIHARLHHDQH